MSDELHVLVYGGTEVGVCAFYRFDMYREALGRLGVIVRPFVKARLAFDEAFGDRSDLALAGGEVILDREQLDWADVVVFARFYQTAWWGCTSCIATALSEAAASQHAKATGHVLNPPDPLLRPLFDTLERWPDALRGRAILYETDDDLLHVQAWNSGPRLWMSVERDLVERMARRADLVTVSTPVLAAVYGRYNRCVRVVRNAIDPSWYPPRPSESILPGDPRLLYYGAAVRMRDYAVCRDAVDETKRRFPDARRIWLGATAGAVHHGSPAEAIAAVDETLPYVTGMPAFAQALVAARPDIGLAPVLGDDFDRARSELHWLEYSMAGAATVASRMMQGGPYDVIRGGVDGLLARSKADWRDALAQLASSASLREDLAGRARERVLAEYRVEARAAEWAEAYRWAAEHAGCGATGRQYSLGSAEMDSVSRAAGLGLAHRRRSRRESAEAPERLAGLRGEREMCWSAEDADRPLVSVVVPVAEAPVSLVERALRSVLQQDYPEIEAVVAAAPDPELSAMIDRLADSRLRLVDVPTPADLPADPVWRRSAVEAAALAAGTGAARGAWIAPLSPESEFTPNHVSLLLDTAVEHGLEFVYGQAKVALEGVEPFTIGSWPPISQGVLTLGSELYSARLHEVASYDPEAWRELGMAPWTQWSAFVRAGVRMANAEAVVAQVTSWSQSSSAATPAG
jgi:glycosyltransferase involved in cell wall biosynthesis